MKRKIRILIVDDHFIVRIGLLTTIKMSPDLVVVAEASTGAQAIDLYRRHLPDVVLMDVRLPDFSGIEATATLRGEFSGAKVVIISTFDTDEDVYRAFQAGACGYLLKSVLGENWLPPSTPSIQASGTFRRKSPGGFPSTRLGQI